MPFEAMGDIIMPHHCLLGKLGAQNPVRISNYKGLECILMGFQEPSYPRKQQYIVKSYIPPGHLRNQVPR